MSKFILRGVLYIFLILGAIQSVTYYTISGRKLIKATGKNYDTFVLDRNRFTGITFVTNSKVEPQSIKKNFALFQSYDVEISGDYENPFTPISEERYEYIIKNKTRNPFVINDVWEMEHAPYYGASWESEYIWILFDWMLIKKENKGIS
jgi:hypothetical protein